MTPAITLLALLAALTLAVHDAEAKRAGGGRSSAPAPAAKAAPVKPATPPGPAPSVNKQATEGTSNVKTPSTATKAAVGAAVGTAAGVAAGQALTSGSASAADKGAAKGEPAEETTPANPLMEALSQPFTYNAVDKRDPFRSPIKVVEEVQEEEEAKPKRDREPLESFPLESLKLVAILIIKGSPAAIIEDPSGRGYTVRIGNYMGTQEGRITGIGDGRLELLENRPTTLDPKATSTTVLKLREELQR